MRGNQNGSVCPAQLLKKGAGSCNDRAELLHAFRCRCMHKVPEEGSDFRGWGIQVHSFIWPVIHFSESRVHMNRPSGCYDLCGLNGTPERTGIDKIELNTG